MVYVKYSLWFYISINNSKGHIYIYSYIYIYILLVIVVRSKGRVALQRTCWSLLLQRNFETEKQPGDVDCVAWFQSKLALLRDVKMADDAYNDNVTNFLKYYTKSLNSTKTSRAVYSEISAIELKITRESDKLSINLSYQLSYIYL